MGRKSTRGQEHPLTLVPRKHLEVVSWLGKPDEDNFTWVRMMFTSDTNVRCVKVFAGDNYESTELRG
jgi:hypothetical protein